MSGVGRWPEIAAQWGSEAPIALGEGTVTVEFTDEDGNLVEIERPVEVLYQGRVYRADVASGRYLDTGVTMD